MPVATGNAPERPINTDLSDGSRRTLHHGIMEFGDEGAAARHRGPTFRLERRVNPMWKKTLLALATVAALAGFGTIADTAPAAAQGMHRPLPPRMHAPAPRMHVAPRYAAPRYVTPRYAGMHGPRPVFRHGPPHRRHWRGHGWYGGWYASGLLIPPPGVYGYYDGYTTCRIVRKRVRIETDYGWRWGWRKVRRCV
jgi:hypothetical protein